jgi:glyoxylase-like metal-dependent hydrolase (beta-lactamase superfamily II)
MSKHTRTAVLSFLAAASLSLDGTLTATADSRLQTRQGLASPISFIGWIAVTPLQTIVYHLDTTLTDQLAAIGLKTIDITYLALSHTHGDHIGNVRYTSS